LTLGAGFAALEIACWWLVIRVRAEHVLSRWRNSRMGPSLAATA
jgi:hypothetical protein